MQAYIPREIDINGFIKDFSVKQRDHLSRLLCVKIFDDEITCGDIRKPLDLSGCKARLYFEEESVDSSVTTNIANRYINGEIIDEKGGVVKFLLTNGITNLVGKYKCEIYITNSEEMSEISTKPFYIEICQSIRDDEALLATDEFNALQIALRSVDRIDERFDSANSKIDSVDNKINEVSEFLSGKIDKESGRIDNRINEVVESLSDDINKETEKTNKRIDSILALPEGTTALDWEVIDIRNGYDGETHYDSAGQAVRYQIQAIHDKLTDMVATSEEFWGVINETNSNDEDANENTEEENNQISG